jgi:hypothetical protein
MTSPIGVRVFIAILFVLQAATICNAAQIPPPRNRPGRAPTPDRKPIYEASDKISRNIGPLPADSQFAIAVNSFRNVQQEQLSLAAANDPSARILVYRICCGEMGNRFLVRTALVTLLFLCCICVGAHICILKFDYAGYRGSFPRFCWPCCPAGAHVGFKGNVM